MLSYLPAGLLVKFVLFLLALILMFWKNICKASKVNKIVAKHDIKTNQQLTKKH
jgi:hypothetical protein